MSEKVHYPTRHPDSVQPKENKSTIFPDSISNQPSVAFKIGTMFRNIFNCKIFKIFSQFSSESFDEALRASNEEWDKMEKELDIDIDNLLGEGIKKSGAEGQEDNNEGSDPEVSHEEWTENMLGLMKEMEFQFDSRKKRASRFWFNAAIGLLFAVVGVFLFRLYSAGRWTTVAFCTGDKLPRICHSCYGPFSEEWLWCIGD